MRVDSRANPQRGSRLEDTSSLQSTALSNQKPEMRELRPPRKENRFFENLKKEVPQGKNAGKDERIDSEVG